MTVIRDEADSDNDDDDNVDVEKRRTNSNKMKNAADNASVNSNSITNRIRKTHRAALTRAFVDVMREYNDVKVVFRRKCKERIKRQLEITGRSGLGIGRSNGRWTWMINID